MDSGVKILAKLWLIFFLFTIVVIGLAFTLPLYFPIYFLKRVFSAICRAGGPSPSRRDSPIDGRSTVVLRQGRAEYPATGQGRTGSTARVESHDRI